jgi:hypothetical protein
MSSLYKGNRTPITGLQYRYIQGTLHVQKLLVECLHRKCEGGSQPKAIGESAARGLHDCCILRRVRRVCLRRLMIHQAIGTLSESA